MKTSEIVILAGVGLIAYELLRTNSAAAANAALTPAQQAQQQLQQQQLETTGNQAYIREGTGLLTSLFGLFNGQNHSGNPAGPTNSYFQSAQNAVYDNSYFVP